MKIFIDSANIDEIKEAISWDIVDGVTTNPSLIKKAVEYFKNQGISFTMEEYIEKLLKVAGIGHPVSLEVIGNTEDDMLGEAETLFAKFNNISNNVIIKIPVNPEIEENGTKHFDGLKVIKKLKEKNIPVNCTLIMSSNQALLAAKAGAKYVSPFAGRIDDFLRKKIGMIFEKEDYYPEEGLIVDDKVLNDEGIVSGVDLVASIKEILDNFDFDTEIIAASVRNARQVRELAEVGVHIATIPFSVIKEMVKHPKTFEGMINFMKDTIPEYRETFK
jgi:transaldolase